MLLDVIILLGAGVALYFGAEWLVGGASSLALSFRLPQLLVGLTVVAYGTSAPEIAVGIQAALAGHGDVAVGNAIGSNIANIGLILGLSVLVRPARVDGALRRRELPLLALTALALPFLIWDERISRIEGVLLVGVALSYTVAVVHAARSTLEQAEAEAAATATAEAADRAGAPAPRGRLASAGIAVVGLGVLLFGGHHFVESATRIALGIAISERVVGLTIVAVGTSLPELATSLIAASRGHSDIAVGNVVGSNIFNVLVCLGGAGTVAPFGGLSSAFLTDLVVLGGFTLAALVFLRAQRVFERWEGAVLFVGYVAYVVRVAGAQ
ncbi:MAG: calcium/sodium antiporter [Sandaracinaceae bacterium]